MQVMNGIASREKLFLKIIVNVRQKMQVIFPSSLMFVFKENVVLLTLLLLLWTVIIEIPSSYCLFLGLFDLINIGDSIFALVLLFHLIVIDSFFPLQKQMANSPHREKNKLW